MIDETAMKGTWVIIPAQIQQKTLDQLHSNHMVIKRKHDWLESPYTGQHECRYKKNMVKIFSTCLKFQQMQPNNKVIPHKIPHKLWEVIGTDLFSINK